MEIKLCVSVLDGLRELLIFLLSSATISLTMFPIDSLTEVFKS